MIAQKPNISVIEGSFEIIESTLHCTGGRTEIQRGEVTSPPAHSWVVAHLPPSLYCILALRPLASYPTSRGLSFLTETLRVE